MRHLSKFAETSESRGAVVALKDSAFSPSPIRSALKVCICVILSLLWFSYVLSLSLSLKGSHTQNVGWLDASGTEAGRWSGGTFI
jgi:hypothetical protein